MINTIVALVYDWANGVVMISIFVLVCIILIGVLVNFMMGGKGNSNNKDNY